MSSGSKMFVVHKERNTTKNFNQEAFCKSNNLGDNVMQWDSWFILFALWHDHE